MIPNIRLLGPKVLVALEPKATDVEASTRMHYHDKGHTETGIILAQPTDMYDSDDHSRGMVMALGTKKDAVSVDAVRAMLKRALDDSCRASEIFVRLDRMRPAEFDVEIGDVVLFSPSAGISLGEDDDGVTHVILLESDITAVIQPKESAIA